MFSVPLRSTRAGRRVLLCGALGVPLLAAGAAQAEDLCTRMNGLVVQAETNFSDGSAANAAEPAALPGAESCRLSLTPGGQRAYHCAWRFAYRDGGAQAAFDEFTQALESCFGERARISRDQAVNHPDFYDLRRYRLDTAAVTVSIKDKIARDSTYVFLRVHAETAE